VPTKRFSKRRC